MTEEAICKWIEGDDWQWDPGWSEVQPLTRCKDCARSENCFMYRESGDDNGYCAWAVKRDK